MEKKNEECVGCKRYTHLLFCKQCVDNAVDSMKMRETKRKTRKFWLNKLTRFFRLGNLVEFVPK